MLRKDKSKITAFFETKIFFYNPVNRIIIGETSLQPLDSLTPLSHDVIFTEIHHLAM